MVDPRLLAKLDIMAAVDALDAQKKREAAALVPKEPVEDTRTSSERRQDRINQLKEAGKKKLKVKTENEARQGRNGKVGKRKLQGTPE